MHPQERKGPRNKFYSVKVINKQNQFSLTVNIYKKHSIQHEKKILISFWSLKKDLFKVSKLKAKSIFPNAVHNYLSFWSFFL